ncbi:helix-turn-helix domain-containing protein, partial [Aeribacillus pallidus]|uniref:helix-turn-helix domain-containing protein n=1 Tax=Aeribacillus pallidus TaxID=33936 RepID=UPI003D1BBECD
VIFMAKKGQKFQTYTFEMKLEAVKMKEAGYTNAQINEKLGIKDKDRLKVWWRKYKKDGEAGLIDRRGRRKEYKDQDRYVRKLEMENAILKKYLEILNKEGRK